MAEFAMEEEEKGLEIQKELEKKTRSIIIAKRS